MFFSTPVLNHRSNEGLSPLLYAIQNHHPSIAYTLLNHGADFEQEAQLKDKTMTPLAFAFEHHELEVMKLLLENGVEDVRNKVLLGAFMSQDHDVITLLLQFKSVRDSTHGINKSELWRLSGHGEHHRSRSLERLGLGDEETQRPKLLASAVAIQWQGLSALYQIETHCLAKASLRLNPTIRNMDLAVALCTITKVDISGNSFRRFPECLLMLPSLVVLNASKNTIIEMPEEDDQLSINFMCPVLEELHLQKNKLATVPAFVFRFPALKYLDVSFNSIKELPPEMWMSPSLITLDLTRNVLTKLPLFSKDSSIPRKMSLLKRMSAASVGGGSNSWRESRSGSVSAGSIDLEVNTSMLDNSVDSVAAGVLPAQGDFTINEMVHVNRWSYSLKVGSHYLSFVFNSSKLFDNI